MSDPASDPQLETLLTYLRDNRGFDFSGYKPATLERRIHRRMQDVKVEAYAEYIDYLEVHPDEFAFLFNTILINVTSFFRDPEAWAYLAAEVIPKIVADKEPGEAIRAMSAGCSSGEEAFTIAILLAEALGPEAFRQRVKVYATDLDEEALAQARQATYSAQSLEAVPPALREKYFELNSGRYHFRGDLRRSVIFGRHDITRDAPISRLDLLVCRNTLMYFNAETQRRILQRFHYALRGGGYLFLGKAEMLISHGSTFATVDLKHRLFARLPGTGARMRVFVDDPPAAEVEAERKGVESHSRVLRERALEMAPDAMLVVDFGGKLVVASEQARALFSLSARDLGRLFQDLEVSYRPLELRSLLEQAYRDAHTIAVSRVERHLPSRETQFLDVVVSPLRGEDGAWLGACVSFQNRTAYYLAQQQLDRTKHELESAYEELQSTNEELETTNEELQSTVEELQTTNEELQSTNEEMETMNEELQATNVELQTTNERLAERTVEADRTSAFLRSILASVHAGVVVVDAELKVLLWNDQAEDLWGLRASEANGQRLAALDIGLPVELLAERVRAFLSGKATESELTFAATNRRGKAIQCRITCTLRPNAENAPPGVVLMMEEAKP